jgi:signal transduction histidine kinase
MGFESVLRWFSGGEAQYMRLTHCMNHDMPWIGLTVALDLAVASGYLLIARHWWVNQRRLASDSPARRALGRMRNIFVFCGLCGYLFIPIKLFWPAWRLYDLFMLPLVYLTWRYALDSRDMRVVYNELGRTDQLARDLEESRLESCRKSEFLNAVSHDLSTPLNGLALAVCEAEDQISGGDIGAARDAISAARVELRAASSLLEHFLELGRLDWSADTIRMSTFSLRECLETLAERVRPVALNKSLELEFVPMEELRVHTDQLKLQRIVLSLLNNAVRFTERGRIELAVREEGGAVRIDVTDDGIGIASEELARVFDEFYQGHNPARDRNKGYGLGLSIARRVAHRIGGEIVAQSVVGRGSRFSVVLPRESLRSPGPPGLGVRDSGATTRPVAGADR